MSRSHQDAAHRGRGRHRGNEWALWTKENFLMKEGRERGQTEGGALPDEPGEAAC